jgi:hypothetical protein
MALTRFKDARKGEDGPVSGAIMCIPVSFDDVANNETVSQRIELPAGAAFEITDIKVSADSVTSDPALTIGDTAAGTQVVASVNVATDLGALTIKDGTIDAGGFIDVVCVADAGDAAESVSISIWGYLTAPPTSVLQSDRGGAAGY